MKAGKLNQLIKIYRIKQVQNELGEMVPCREFYTKAFASVTFTKGGEKYVSARFVSECEVLFTVRYREDIGATHEIEWNGRTFEVLAVLPIGNKDGIAINAKEQK